MKIYAVADIHGAQYRLNLVLKNIDHWITREDYINPKPNPECYLRAILLYGKKGDRMVGFEDTIKGINALLQTPAKPVLIGDIHHPQVDVLLDKRVETLMKLVFLKDVHQISLNTILDEDDLDDNDMN